MKALSSFILLTFILSGFQVGRAEALTSTLRDQRDVAVTIYNSNLGLVKDIRLLELRPGIQELKFMDVAARIDPTTVHITSLERPSDFAVLEQNYEYDLISPQKLLEKYVGQKVQLVRTHPETNEEEIVDAVLLSTQGGNIFQINDKISIGHPGRILLPKIPENLIPKPTLVWIVDNQTPAPQKVEASYLTSGITWRADYVAVVNQSDTLTDLTGWVTVENKSGATYPNALLKLVAGDIHRVQPEMDTASVGVTMAQKAAAPQFREESFFEYHLYTLERRTTIKDNQTKQMSLLDVKQAPLRKIFLFSGSPQFFYPMDQNAARQKVGVFLELVNSKENHLGIPLPKGTVRVYKEDKDRSLQFIGEDRIDHTPKDERVKIKIGDAFDVVGGRVQTEYKRLSRNLVEVAFEITLKNHKKEKIQVSVEEPVPGDWEMVSNTHPFEKPSAHLIRFEVPVPADQEVKIRYRVRLKY